MIKTIFVKIKLIVTKKLFRSFFYNREYKRVIKNFKSFINKEEIIINNFQLLDQSNNRYYNDLLSQYCITNGKICDELQEIISIKYPKPNRKNVLSKFFPEIKNDDIQNIVSNLKTNGYYVYDRLLNDEICNTLYQKSLNIPFTTAVDSIKGDRINFDDIKGEVCFFENNDILGIDIIKKLICDDFFIAVAENYFNSEVIFDFPAMWWSFPFKKRNNMDSAQFYHFDFDRIKWLKVFIYLVDVDENNGPHCYIEKSHIPGNKPNEFLKRGYVRISDDEIYQFYNKNDIKQITGKKGTIVFGDTKCWHKGSPLIKGHRLLLEFQYTSSLYGAVIKGAKINKNDIENLNDILELNPNFFNNINLY